ncbi:GAF domain-containing protein [Roseibium aggregatum]|uniref:GAF domain-containing protein n=1 Tax=Roseibium aggregatum TaxID=187304 RepID=A0A926P134_9HYPH|nr:GAF domain-containing protein [Roseibium aggregatum]MBD1549269.1 GAF domain-containing protein [Roseibium aggregatum]
MSGIRIENLRRSLEGVVASVLATCDGDGMPNVSMISQVHYVDADHVALSYQFFNKTRRNLLLTKAASVLISDPATMASHRLELEFVETRTSGPLFESMKAKLAGIASHHGMEGVFRLLGADIFRIRSIAEVPFLALQPPPLEPPLLPAVRKSICELDTCTDLDELLDLSLECLERHFGVSHSMILMVDAKERRLYTVASRGYAKSGVGFEAAFGEGVIGVAALENTPIRIGHMTSDYRYGAALADTAQRAGLLSARPAEIAFPGLASPGSQIALPIAIGKTVSGILFAEAEEVMRFGYDDEDALAVLAGYLGAMIELLREDEDDASEDAQPADTQSGTSIAAQLHQADQSVFLDHNYLIKGVAGAILWKLLREYVSTGRTDFSNRELRLDPGLRLPVHSENLEARLILLRKRLEERQAGIRIEKIARGRFRLVVESPVTLEEFAGSGGAGIPVANI